MTDAERRLWQGLRGRQMDGYKFRRQHPYYDFILDFVCLEQKLVIEVDGGQHSGSISDKQRDGFLEKGGFRVLRFWNNDVLNQTNNVLEAIYRSLTHSHHPHPSPPLEGEGA
jgi:very-short-patch-repair endonuclease